MAQAQSYDDHLLEKFCAQLLEALPFADAVAIQGLAGQLACQLPATLAGSISDWTASTELPNAARLYRYARSSEETALAFECPLRLSDDSQAYGRLLIRMTGEDAAHYKPVLEQATPIIDCISRHFAIAQELSSVRRISKQSQNDMQYLTQVDQILCASNSDSVVGDMLASCANYLNCTLVALLVPGRQLRAVWPPEQNGDDYRKTPVLAALAKLHAKTAENRTVVISNDPNLSRMLETSAGRGTQTIGSPLTDSLSRVSGTLILAREEPFSRDDLRMMRALCVKISAFFAAAGNTVSPNADRRGLIDRVDADIKIDPHTSRAILYIDIDQLHIVNDRYGHDVGDALIAAVGNTLEKNTQPRDLLANLSGDLWGLYLNVAAEAQARVRAEALLREVSECPLSTANGAVKTSVSIGVAMIPENAKNGSQAISIAEVASRSAKARGTGQYVVFKDQDASIMQRHSDLSQIGGLQSALIEDRFVLHAQEIRSLRTNESARKFELLTRMLDIKGNLVAPQKFLSAAERYQMMPAVDRWVINKALEQLSSSDNLLEINLSGFNINVSGQSIAEPGFTQFVVDSVLNSGLSPDSLCFELTESAAVRQIDTALRFISEVRAIGCRIALDDFGTGYCSFAYLQDLPVDFLKVDGMFVRDICSNDLSATIVASVARIAEVMHASTVAEYVENDMIATKLKELGIDYAQGFGIGRPEPLSDVLDRMVSPLELGLTGALDLTRAALP